MSTPLSSLQWTSLSDLFALSGVLFAAWAAWVDARAMRGGSQHARNSPAGWMTLCLWLAAAAMGVAMVQRGIEVNHFPSQTMSEVLLMFTTALLVSMIALHYALGLRSRGPGWAILDQAIVSIVLVSSVATHRYISTLSTAQRDLPPALQSYWFPPHLSSLIFSYATLAIAGAICLIYFSLRFWSGVFTGGQPRKRQIWTALSLCLIPFAQVVTLPVLLLCGALFFVLARFGRAPNAVTIAGFEKSLDDISYRAFSVGMPFLTAGLFMGAFWAQEAWANYWGWDSKENSALITWLVYVIYIHLRMLGGYRGEKAMAVLMAGTLSIFITFQLFGYLPDSQKSMHRYTDDNVVPREGMQGPTSDAEQKTSQVQSGVPEEKLASKDQR